MLPMNATGCPSTYNEVDTPPVIRPLPEVLLTILHLDPSGLVKDRALSDVISFNRATGDPCIYNFDDPLET